MTQPSEPAIVTVTQEDEDAANALSDALGFLTDLERPIVVQAFARHRPSLTDHVADAGDMVARERAVLIQRARIMVRNGGPHEWGYRDLTDGTFITDPFPFQAALVLAALAAPETPPTEGEAKDELGDYPLAPMDGVEPVFVRQMMLQAMAAEYAKATGDSLEDMMPAARATWDTDWENDPAPRTMADAVAAAQDDLEHWGDEA